jgi:hypothetical protein
MPDKAALQYIVSKTAADVQNVRLAGVNKPFEQLTINELVQLRPGAGGDSADSYSVNAVSSDVTISTSSALSELAQLRAQESVRAEMIANQVHNTINDTAPARNIIVKLPQ